MKKSNLQPYVYRLPPEPAMTLEETGQTKTVRFDMPSHRAWGYTAFDGTVRVIMTIKAPRGICQIYDKPLDKGGVVPEDYWNSRALAVRAFMRQHREEL